MSFPPAGGSYQRSPRNTAAGNEGLFKGAGGWKRKKREEKDRKRDGRKSSPLLLPQKKNKFVVRDLTADAEEREESTRGEMSERRSNMDTNAHTTHTGNNR